MRFTCARPLASPSVTVPLTLASLALIFGGLAQATSPSGGTLDLDHQVLTATGGPYFVSNAGECAAGTCDEYALTVDLPADYATAHPDDIIIIELAYTPQNTDLDMRLLDEAGNEVASSGNAPGQTEQIVLNAPGGVVKYTVVIIPFAAGVASADLRISLVQRTLSDGPPTGSGSPPRFRNHHSPPGLGDGAGEPSIGYNLDTKHAMFLAGLETDRVTFAENSGQTDVAGQALPEACDETWEDVSAPNTSLVSLDPILFTEQSVGRTFVSQLAATNSNFAFTDDDGENWLPGQLASSNAAVDHQTVGSGPYPADFIGVKNPDGYAVYYCSQLPEAFCSRSDDGGVNFGPAMPAFGPQECGGLHGHIRVGLDGTMYLPFKYCLAQQAVSVSENAGLSWVVRKVPNSLGGDTDPQMAIATDGTGYFCFANGDGRPMVAITKDKGRTWTEPVNLGATHGIKNTVFAQGIAGDPDRAACAFISTTTPGNSGAEDFPGIWYGYIAMTHDGGASWHTVNATPNDPVQGAGGICTAGIACGGNRNLLDFNEITLDETGRVLFGYADGCTGSCVQNPDNNSFTDNGVIVRQTGGRTLLSAFDPAEPAKPKRACLSGTRTADNSILGWTAPDNGGAAIVNYKLYRGTSLASQSLLVTLSPKTGYTDYTADPNEPVYFYKIVAINAVGDSEFSNLIELPIDVNTPPETPCVPPGLTILTDPEGDALNGQAAHDIRRLSISQPYFENGDYKLAFTLKMRGLSTVPPDTTWPVLFRSANGVDYAARMDTVVGGQVRFTVATGANNTNAALNAGTAADPASGFSADGAITIVVKASAIGLTNEGAGLEKLSQFLVRIRVEAGAVAQTPDNMPDSLGRAGEFATKALNFCATNTPPLPNLKVDIQSGPAPLTVLFDASGSTDPDSQDNIAEYIFDFGDGTENISQSTPTIIHTYTGTGFHRATLRVKDSRGLVGTSVAAKVIEVTPGLAPSGVDNTRLGGATSSLSLLVLSLLGVLGLGRGRRGPAAS